MFVVMVSLRTMLSIFSQCLNIKQLILPMLIPGQDEKGEDGEVLSTSIKIFIIEKFYLVQIKRQVLKAIYLKFQVFQSSEKQKIDHKRKEKD